MDLNGELMISMDWFKRKSAGNHGFYHEIWRVPVNKFSQTNPMPGVSRGIHVPIGKIGVAEILGYTCCGTQES